MMQLTHRHLISATTAALVAALTGLGSGAASGQDDWNVFDHRQGKGERKPEAAAVQPERRPAGEPSQPARPYLAPFEGRFSATPSTTRPGSATNDSGREPVGRGADGRHGGAVERSSLEPIVPGTDAPGARAAGLRAAEPEPALAPGAWNGLDDQALERLLAGLDIPPASAVMSSLWRRLLLTERDEGGRSDSTHFTALRVEALTRSGRFAEAAGLLGRLRPDSALAMVLKARNDIATGERETGCAEIGPLLQRIGELPELLKEEGLLVAGYCAAASGNPAAAGLAANLAREAGIQRSAAIDALDAIAAGQTPEPTSKGTIQPIEFRILEIAGAANVQVAIDSGGPTLLAALAGSKRLDPVLRLTVSEAAAARNALAPEGLAEAYRAVGAAGAPTREPEAGELPLFAAQAARRAGLLAAAEREPQPEKKAWLVQTYLEESRRAGLFWPSLRIADGLIESIAPSSQMSWFAETAVEAAIASGRIEAGRAWAETGARHGTGAGGSLGHWLALADIAEPNAGARRGAGFDVVEAMARDGRLDAALLHRLATVMEALDISVPLGLWELASRGPQPDEGYLPQTGVLSELQEASRRREIARTILLVLQTLGAQRAEGMHIIGLGDSIRALRRAGFASEARELGLEALLPAWPRTVAR